MKKLLLVLGICGLLVGCKGEEISKLEAELAEVKASNEIYKNALLNPNDYDVEVNGDEFIVKEKSDYDKSRDEIMKDYKEPSKDNKSDNSSVKTVSITEVPYEALPQDLDTSFRVSPDRLHSGGDPDDEANGDNGSVHYVVPFFQEPRNEYDELYILLQTDYDVEGIMSYCVEPAKNVAGAGSEVYLGLKLKKKK